LVKAVDGARPCIISVEQLPGVSGPTGSVRPSFRLYVRVVVCTAKREAVVRVMVQL